MKKRRNGSFDKSARIIILLDLIRNGALNDLTLQQIADLFPTPPHRSTIMRDLRDIKELEKVLDGMRKKVGQTIKELSKNKT